MRVILGAILVLAVSSFSYAECANEMETFNMHQNVIKGMMDMNFQGKLNQENSKDIGVRMKEAQKASESGEYAKSCEMYESIMDEYGFEKVFGANQGNTENTTKEEKPAASESSASSTAAEDASASPQGK